MKKIIFVLVSIVVWYACSEDEPGIPEVSGVSFSDFLDTRDSSVYKCITVGGQTWMAENLRYRIPWGSYRGCYSYYETQLDSTDFFADETKFVQVVKEALNQGSIIDPDGSVAKYIGYVGMLWTVDMFIKRYDAFPDLKAQFVKIKKELEQESIDKVAVIALDKAEKKNGGYKDEFGFLYTYEAAKAALPEGWELPTDEDWRKLEQALGMKENEADKMEDWRGGKEGVALKEGGQGIGFDVRLAGGRLYGGVGYGTVYKNRQADAYFWTSTETRMNDSTGVVMIRKFFYNEDRIFRGTSKTNGVAYSVRGIKR